MSKYMSEYFYVALGGLVGAVLRYSLKNVGNIDGITQIPFSTLGINILGTFVLAFFLSYIIDKKDFSMNIRLAVSVGITGGFTTFSTLCKELVFLARDEKYILAITYICLSFTIGFAAAYSGNRAAQLVKKTCIKEIEDVEGGVK